MSNKKTHYHDINGNQHDNNTNNHHLNTTHEHIDCKAPTNNNSENLTYLGMVIKRIQNK